MAIFEKATKKKSKAKVGLIGPPKSGKTYTALTLAKCWGGRTALVDGEHGSASKYADIFKFDTIDLEDFDPRTYTKLIKLAEAEGYDNLILDNISHEWDGLRGVLELVDEETAKMQSMNKFTSGWRIVTPWHRSHRHAIDAAEDLEASA